VYYSKSIAFKVNNTTPISFNIRRIKIELNETLFLNSIQCLLYWKYFHSLFFKFRLLSHLGSHMYGMWWIYCNRCWNNNPLKERTTSILETFKKLIFIEHFEVQPMQSLKEDNIRIQLVKSCRNRQKVTTHYLSLCH